MGAFDEKAPITIPNPDNAEESAAFRKKWGWEPHEQVLIKGQITVAEQEYVTNHHARIKDKRNSEIELQSGTGRFSLLDCMIVDWTLSRNGQKVPVNAINIRKLPANYSNPILEEIDALAVSMTEEEQEDFLPSVNGHIEGSLESTSLLPMTS